MSSDGLRLHGVTAGFDDLVVLDGFELAVEPGEIVALLGPSGCGKSTVLRCIAGLQPLWSGSITWRGADWSSTPTHERRVGLMFQHHALFPHRNVAQNVGFGLRMQRVDTTERHERVDELLETVGLAGYGPRTIDTLSGGEAQRVALARALAPRPDVLLLDEPLASLDRARRDQLVEEIRALVVERGITTIHVTHDQDEAASVADRVALLRHGRIVESAAYDDLIERPGDLDTAQFLGIETLWTGVADASGVVETPLGPVDTGLEPGSVAGVLVRPEHVQSAPGGTPLTAVSCRRAGSGWVVRCTIDGSATTDRSAANLALVAPERVAEGTRLEIDGPAALSAAEILRS